jgi:VanZ family protein
MHYLISFISRFWQSITLVILALITIASLFPVEHLPAVPGSDKTHHFISYCGLMLPAAIRRPKHWLTLVLIFIVWSGLIELIQPYVNRYGEWLDLFANMGGILLAIIIAQCLRWFIADKN